MKILKVKLKQHTPLVHFQHDQYGATLRASEVKPLLDKFIIKRLTDGGNNDLLDRWKKGDTNALNYKLKIQASEVDKLRVKIPERMKNGKFEAQFPLLLANMDGKDTRDELMNFSCYKEITMIFISSDETLLNLINVYLDTFLTFTNFGNRKSKGFGSFYRKEKSQKDFEKKLSSLYTCVYYKKFPSFNIVNFDSVRQTFNTLDTEYKKIKSGMNRYESKLHAYGHKHGIEWEKLAIKNKLDGHSIPDNVYYLRAILGTTNSVSLTNINKVISIKSELDGRGEEVVQRFRSPITFKFFDKTVYALSEEGVEDIVGKRFTFTIKDKQTNMERGHFDLRVPKVNFDDFFDFAFSSLGWSRKNFD